MSQDRCDACRHSAAAASAERAARHKPTALPGYRGIIVVIFCKTHQLSKINLLNFGRRFHIYVNTSAEYLRVFRAFQYLSFEQISYYFCSISKADLSTNFHSYLTSRLIAKN